MALGICPRDFVVRDLGIALSISNFVCKERSIVLLVFSISGSNVNDTPMLHCTTHILQVSRGALF